MNERKEYIGLIDKEIEHHKRIYLRDQHVAKEFKDGFIAGLQHIRELLIQARIAELYPDHPWETREQQLRDTSDN